ncbi:MAG: VOC family protein [Acidobacteria bacterium]|nr:VOC family protein [Acidobacteriota bacterium]
MLVHLNYLIVYCSDMKQSLAFYRDRLGFPVKLELSEWCEFHSGAVTLALQIGKPAHPDKPRSQPGEAEVGQARFSLEVVDIEKFFQEKTAQGVEFVLPPTQLAGGRKMAILLDPDGLPISVMEEFR